VYRALALEGVAAVESSNTIMLVPEGKEPKLNPELLDGSQKGIPDGRQRLVKMFRLAYMQAADLREKVRGLISEKGTMDVDERANQLIVTDYNDNLRLLADIIREFDVPASGLMLEIYPLKYLEAEELASLLGLILNVQPASPGGGRSPSASPVRVSMPSIGGAMPVPMPGGGPPSSGDSGGGGGGPPASSGSSPPPGQQVRIWPDKTFNRLIIFAPKSKHPEVQRLIEILD